MKCLECNKEVEALEFEGLFCSKECFKEFSLDYEDEERMYESFADVFYKNQKDLEMQIARLRNKIKQLDLLAFNGTEKTLKTHSENIESHILQLENENERLKNKSFFDPDKLAKEIMDTMHEEIKENINKKIGYFLSNLDSQIITSKNYNDDLLIYATSLNERVIKFQNDREMLITELKEIKDKFDETKLNKEQYDKIFNKELKSVNKE